MGMLTNCKVTHIPIFKVKSKQQPVDNDEEMSTGGKSTGGKSTGGKISDNNKISKPDNTPPDPKVPPSAALAHAADAAHSRPDDAVTEEPVPEPVETRAYQPELGRREWNG